MPAKHACTSRRMSRPPPVLWCAGFDSRAPQHVLDCLAPRRCAQCTHANARSDTLTCLFSQRTCVPRGACPYYFWCCGVPVHAVDPRGVRPRLGVHVQPPQHKAVPPALRAAVPGNTRAHAVPDAVLGPRVGDACGVHFCTVRCALMHLQVSRIERRATSAPLWRFSLKTLSLEFGPARWWRCGHAFLRSIKFRFFPETRFHGV